jgi:hypothetical protein
VSTRRGQHGSVRRSLAQLSCAHLRRLAMIRTTMALLVQTEDDNRRR